MALPPREPLTAAARAQALTCAGVARILASPHLTRHRRWGDVILPRILARTCRGAARPATVPEAARAVAVVVTASRRLGGNTSCLPRALAALLYCRAQGLAATVVIGLAPRTTAHAWLEAEHRPAGEAADPTGQFTPAYRYGATPPAPAAHPTPHAPTQPEEKTG